MRKLLLVALLAGVAAQICYAQFQECDTGPSYTALDTLDVPWYGQNDILDQYVENNPQFVLSTVSSSRSYDDCSVINSTRWIPVKFWVWMPDANTEPVSEVDIQTLLDIANDHFSANDLNFRLYQSCPADFLVDPDKAVFNSDAGFNNLNNGGAQLPEAINIHVTINGQDIEWGGRFGGFLFNDFIGINPNRFLTDDNAATFMHELGHYFNLEHTFIYTQNPFCCKKEPVTRGEKTDYRCKVF